MYCGFRITKRNITPVRYHLTEWEARSRKIYIFISNKNEDDKLDENDQDGRYGMVNYRNEKAVDEVTVSFMITRMIKNANENEQIGLDCEEIYFARSGGGARCANAAAISITTPIASVINCFVRMLLLKYAHHEISLI